MSEGVNRPLPHVLPPRWHGGRQPNLLTQRDSIALSLETERDNDIGLDRLSKFSIPKSASILFYYAFHKAAGGR